MAGPTEFSSSTAAGSLWRPTRLAEAGCSADEISSITGLSPSMIQKQIYNVTTKVHSKAAIQKRSAIAECLHE
jgi:hypothetical protein